MHITLLVRSFFCTCRSVQNIYQFGKLFSADPFSVVSLERDPIIGIIYLTLELLVGDNLTQFINARLFITVSRCRLVSI